MRKRISFYSFTLALLFLFSTGCKKDDNKEFRQLIVPDDYKTIQAAIDASSNGDEVIVSVGVYKENIDFKGKLITLRSTEPDDSTIVATTIIDGNGSGTVVKFQSGESAETIIWGFTITGGDAGNQNGGGILVTNSSKPVIKGNIIYDNTAGYGAGIFVTNESQPVIEKNLFFENHANRRGGAIYAIKQSNVTIRDNVMIDHERADGVIHIGGANAGDRASANITGNLIKDNTTDFGTGAIKVTVESTASIVNNEMINNVGASDNSGAAISVTHSSTADILNNTITGNSANRLGAIVIYRESEAVIRGNTITGNSAGEPGGNYGSGGGIAVTYNSIVTIDDNIISDNNAYNPSRGGGGIMVDDSEVIIKENVISGNTAFRYGGGIYFWTSVSATVNDNTISDNNAQGSAQACGGGIMAGSNCNIKLYGNNITDNDAQWFGGGVYVHRDAYLKDDTGSNMPKVNYPPTVEPNNDYLGNTHGDDTHQGANVFFDN